MHAISLISRHNPHTRGVTAPTVPPVQSTGYGDANNRGTVDVYSSIDCDAIGETPLRPLKIGAVAVFTRYVALGDSFTEGVGDPNPSSPNGLRGWADHVAVALAQANPDLRYANLAIRGRRMDEILDEQVHTAAMFEPDLVTIYAGMNNLLLLRNDVDAMMARYAEGLKKLQQTGATVLAFTAADLGTVPLFRRLQRPGRGLQRTAARYRRRSRPGVSGLLAILRVPRFTTVGRRPHPSFTARSRAVRRQSA